MICPKCGISLPDDSLFCENCGTQLAASQQVVDTPPKAFVPEQPRKITNERSTGKQKNSNSVSGERIIKTGAIIIYVIAGCLLLLRLPGYHYRIFPTQFCIGMYLSIMTMNTYAHLNVLYFIYVIALFAIATAMLRVGRSGFPNVDKRQLIRLSIIIYAIAGFTLLLRFLLETVGYYRYLFSSHTLYNILYFSIVIVLLVIATVVLRLSKVNN